MKTFWICVFPELFSLYVLLTLSSFSMHPLFHWHMLFIYLFLAATIFFTHAFVRFVFIKKKKKTWLQQEKKKICKSESDRVAGKPEP